VIARGVPDTETTSTARVDGSLRVGAAAS
jgi:hypothetical protein